MFIAIVGTILYVGLSVLERLDELELKRRLDAFDEIDLEENYAINN